LKRWHCQPKPIIAFPRGFGLSRACASPDASRKAAAHATRNTQISNPYKKPGNALLVQWRSRAFVPTGRAILEQ